MLLTTDEASVFASGRNMSSLIPNNIEVHLISLGNDVVHNYVTDNLLTPSGYQIKANNPEEFIEVLSSTLMMIKTGMCPMM